jgi:hypothetical protein
MGATSFKGMGKVTLGIAVDSVERVALDFAVTLITDNPHRDHFHVALGGRHDGRG